MKIAFNPSTVAALTTPPNNKDITFDLRGRNIFARGVKFYGTDTNTWRDIKVNNVSIGSHTLDLRNGSNTTLSHKDGVVTINSTWRPVVDSLTSDSTTSSLSAKQGKVLKALIDGKSNSGHTHDDRYLKLTGGVLTGNLTGTSATFSGRFHNSGDDEGIIINPASNGYAGLILGTYNGERSVFYFTKGNPFWRYNNGSANLDIKHPKKAGTIALTSDIPTKSSWNYDDRYLRLSGGTMNSDALIRFADSGSWGTDKGPQGARGGLYWSGQSDYVKLYAEETAGDNLDLVIQFGDDNSNGLSIRNKSNVQTSYISAGGVITTGTFKGNLDWSYITNKPATATRWPSWAEVTGKPSSFTPSTHTHGLSNSVFFLNMPNISGNAKWKEVFGYPVNYNLLLSVRINSPAPEWCVGNYGSGILYGGSDTKGFMSSAYNEPLIMWAGGNGSSDDSVPKWYIGIRGTHKSIYNLTTIASEANAAYNLRHSHANKSVLDGITSALINNWNAAYTFVNTITGTDTDKVINKWDEIVNFLAGITEDNKLNTLLNSKLSVYELADKTNVGIIKNNGIYYSTTDASSSTLTNSPFNTEFALINMTSYDGGDDLRRSRLAFNAYGEIKVSDNRDQANTAETWYNVLTSKNSGISGSTIKLNGTSITVYSSGTADGRYVKKTGDTMSGALNFANGTWNKVGDDIYMGDHNIGGQLCLMGITGNTGISFHKQGDASIRKSITFNGSTLYMNGNCDYASLANQSNLLAMNTVPNKTTSTSIGSWSPISGRYVFHQRWSDTSTGSDGADFGIYLDGNLTANMVLDGYYNSLLGFRVIGATGGFLKANGTIDHNTYLTSHQSLSNYYTKGEINTKLNNYLPLSGGTMKGQISSTYSVGTYIGGCTNAIIKAVADGYNSLICAPIKSGNVCISAWTAENNLNFGYAKKGKTENSFDTRMYWDAPNNNLHAAAFTGHLYGTADNAVNSDTTDGVHLEWAGKLGVNDYTWLAGWTNDGKKIKAVNKNQFATSGHNHDGRYVYNYGGTSMNGASKNKNALGMSTTSGISGDWWHILQAAWNDEYRWNSQIAFPTQNRNGMYYRSGLDDNTKWGAWVKLLDTGNSYVTGGKGVINGTTITQVDNAINSTNSTNARKLVNWYSARPTSLNAQFGDGSLRIFYATSSTTEGKSPNDATVLHLAWDNSGGWDSQLAINSPSGRVYSRSQNGGTWQPWKTLAFTTDIPSSLKNPHPLTLKANGTTLAIYDGSSAKEANFTYANVGAASASHTHSYYAVNENYGGFKKAERLPTSGFYQSYISGEDESGGNAPWTGWMHLINCQHSNTNNNYALQIAASFIDNNIFKIRVTNNNVNTAWRDIIHSGNIGSQTVASASKLQTARNLWGNSFNGTTDVSGTIKFNNVTSGLCEGVQWTCGDNDYARLKAGATGSNAGYFEIATSDDGNEPIYVRQYIGVFSTVKRTLTLLDANGFTHFPSYINIGGNENNNSSPDRVWGSNSSDSYLRSYRTSALRVSYASSANTATSANKLTTARNIALGTDLRGSANFDGSNNIIINANINACAIGVGSTNGLPFKRIAHFETGSSWNDNALLLYISQGYINGSNGICRVEFKTNNISPSNSNPSASALVRWLIRNGYGLDSLYAGYYVTTGKAYIDIYLKTTGGYQGTVIRVLQDSRGGINSNVQLINSHYHSDSDHKEAYNSIEAAATALYNKAYTRIVSGSDVGTVSYSDSTGSVHWNNVTNKPSSFTPSSHTHTWTSITGKLVAGNEFNIVNAGFKEDIWFNYLPINDRSKTATVLGYHFGNGAKGHASVVASGFIKNGSNDSYVLLGGGSHKTESSLRVAYASSAGSATSATKVIVNQHTANDVNYPLVWSNQPNTSNVTENQLFKSWADLYYNPKNKRLTVGGSIITSSFIKNGGTSQQLLRADGGVAAFNWTGQSGQPTWLWGGNSQHSYYVYNPSNFRVAYASSAGNADTLDGEHASSFVRAGHYESQDLNKLDTYSFIRSVNSNNKSTSPKGNIGWYNVIQLVHRNGADDGPSYIGQIALGMTTNTDSMFFRGKRTDPWKTVIHSGNIGNQTVTNAYHLRINSANSWSTWYWAGQSGQPSWLWGSNDGTNMYVWNPSNFNVNTAKYLRSLGNQNCQTGRTQAYGDVYTYNTHNGNTGSPTTYTSVIGFGRGTGGTVEIAGGWCDTNLYWRSLRDCCENWFSWRTVLDDSNYASILNNTYLPLAGGTMKSGARISHGDGPLYIGRADNNSWLYVQNMASQAGEANWKIYANGTASFKNLTVNGPTVINGPTTLNSVATLNGLVTNNRGILPASYDVNKNNTACYVWGDAMSTGVTAITDALDPKYVGVVHSQDNGTHWSDMGMSVQNKFSLYANNGSRESIYLGANRIQDLAQVQKNQLMVTFEIPNNLYSQLCWASIEINNGVQTVCTVEIIAKDGTIKNTFTKNLYGWSLVNYINFWGNNSSVVNIGQDSARFVRFKFKHDASNTQVRNALIHKIRLFSYTKFAVDTNDFRSQMAYTGHLYKYDSDLNIKLPNAINCNALNVGSTLSINGSVIDCSAGNISIKSKESGSLMIGTRKIIEYNSQAITFNRKARLLDGLCLGTITFGSTSSNILYSNTRPICIDTMDFSSEFIFEPATDGQLLFFKVGRKYANRIKCTTKNCEVVGAGSMDIYIGKNTSKEIFDDGKSRIFVYVDRKKQWYEFYCG